MKRSTAVLGGMVVCVFAVLCGAGRANAFPTCADPSRTVFAGTFSGQPCRIFDDDPAGCAQAYYRHENGDAVACRYDSGNDECEGTGGDQNPTELNVCQSHVACTNDPGRLVFTGFETSGDDGGACRSFDGDAANCALAYYQRRGVAQSCIYDVNDDTCEGTGGAENDRRFNSCMFGPPSCADATRVLFAGGDGEGSSGGACTFYDGDPTNCALAYYQYEGSTHACLYDAMNSLCKGTGGNPSGFPESSNTCVSAACTGDPSRTLATGYDGDNSCHVYDMDPASCALAFYIHEGRPHACIYDMGDSECEGTGGNENSATLNSCDPPSCTGDLTRVLLAGVDGQGTNPGACHTYDGDPTNCALAFYEYDGDPHACVYDTANTRCEGSGGEENPIALNSCSTAAVPACAEDPTRVIFAGGQEGRPCRFYDGDPTNCALSYYAYEGEIRACTYDVMEAECEGTGGGENPQSLNECRSHVACSEDPTRTLFTGFRGDGNNGGGCHLFNGDPASCAMAFYEYDDVPHSCLHDGTFCEGTGGGENSRTLNTCLPAPSCADATRTVLQQCGDAADQATCEMSYHLAGASGSYASCYWEDGDCLGCGYPNASRGTCVDTCVTCGNGVVGAGEQCDDGNVFDDDCCSSTCTIEANGSDCTDRDYCTVTDGTCNNGSCTAGAARDCSSADNPPCEVGVCNNPDRDCDTDPLPEGTTCDDTDACTNGDQCLNGNCLGAALDCSSFDDQCNVGTCTAGTCGATAVMDMTACDDGNGCTNTDQCTGGVCGGTNETDGTMCGPGALGCMTGGMCSGGFCSGATAQPDGTGCDDGLFCNGADTCASGACTAHAGDPCDGADGDGDCSEQCSEAADNCAGNDPAGAVCDSGGNFCSGPFSCNGSGNCIASANRDCTSLDSTCAVGVCDFDLGACAAQTANFGNTCDDANACNSGEQCGASGCGGGAAVTCDDASNCTSDSCVPATGCTFTAAIQAGCRTAAKSKFQYKNNTDDGKDGFKWKWGNGAATTQAEFGDPTVATDYELCVYGETVGTPTLLLGADIAASNTLWAPVGTKGYKYKDNPGTAGGITKAKLKGNDTDPKSKIILKGKGTNLDDITLPLDPMITGIRVQLTNQTNGICFESQFTALDGDDKKVKAKTP